MAHEEGFPLVPGAATGEGYPVCRVKLEVGKAKLPRLAEVTLPGPTR